MAEWAKLGLQTQAYFTPLRDTMYDSIDDVVWLRKQIEIEQTTRRDLSRLNAKLIAKLEKKNSKQKKQIATLVEMVEIEKLEVKKWKDDYQSLWDHEWGHK
tara:strand:+ start:702 stop:1004 length:303 start_codon:yes stop_codon:yes gene_type:complete